MSIQLGVCCIIRELRNCTTLKKGKLLKTEVFCGRTINGHKNFNLSIAKDKAIANCKDLYKLIEYCHYKNIKSLRISSELFPLILNDDHQLRYEMDFATELLKKAGDYAKEKGVYLLMHPCQYVNLGSPVESVISLSKAILEYHTKILEMLGAEDGVLIIHGGGTYGDIETAKQSWITRFKELPENVRRRVVIEHCERQYNVRDCLQIATECDIPVVFDTHHYQCYNQIYPGKFKEDPADFLLEIVKSWKGKIPVMHISSQKPDSRIGAHADYIEEIPQYLIDFVKKTGTKIRLEVEAKAQEGAVFKLRSQYPQLC
jgi:UV DNA damage endonuclease